MTREGKRVKIDAKVPALKQKEGEEEEQECGEKI